MMAAEMRNEMNVKDYDLDLRIYRMLQDEPFFARLSRQLAKRPNINIPTAGVRFNPESEMFEIQYNPKFMDELPELHQKWVLKHELYHASLGHCTERKLQGICDHVTANCAMDLAINSLPGMKHEAPEFVLMPGRGDFSFINLDEQASEWYAHKIKQDKEDNPEKYEGGQGGGDAQFDNHDDFGDDGSGEGDEGEMVRKIAGKKLADAVAKAARECDVGDGEGEPAGWGSVSSRIKREIKTFANSKKAKLDPKKVLASFIKASISADKKTSVTKRNRRLPGVKFGRRCDHRANIAISIDQSGSVSDQMLEKVFTWLNEFAKFATFTVVPFDDQVFEEKIYVWKKGDKRKRERVLCGGTNFDAPTRWVNSNNFDGHIVVTDMMAPKPIRSNCQRMWITEESCLHYASFVCKEKVMTL